MPCQIKPVYNRGNDFYEFFLGKYMKYSSGIFRDADGDLDVGLASWAAL